MYLLACNHSELWFSECAIYGYLCFFLDRKYAKANATCFSVADISVSECAIYGYFNVFACQIGNMSKPMLLVSLLLILIITSQFEWRQQLVSDVDTTPMESQKQQQIPQREESVKEKVIVSFCRSFSMASFVGNHQTIMSISRFLYEIIIYVLLPLVVCKRAGE